MQRHTFSTRGVCLQKMQITFQVREFTFELNTRRDVLKESCFFITHKCLPVILIKHMQRDLYSSLGRWLVTRTEPNPLISVLHIHGRKFPINYVTVVVTVAAFTTNLKIECFSYARLMKSAHLWPHRTRKSLSDSYFSSSSSCYFYLLHFH